jgi:hypothetical protein
MLEVAGDDPAVGRHLVAGAYAQQIAELNIVDRHFAFAAVGLDAQRGFRLQFDQLADRLAGLALGPLLHVATEQDEGADAGSRFEIDVVMHFEHTRNAVGPGGAGADGDQRVHVRLALPGQRPGLAEDAVAAAEQDRARQRELHHPQGRRAVHQHPGNHHRHGHQRRLDEALPGFLDARLLALDQQTALGQGVHRPGLVTQAANHIADPVAVDDTMHGQRRRGEVDHRRAHTRIALELHLDQQRAGGAAHAFDGHRTFADRAVDRHHRRFHLRCRQQVAEDGIERRQQARFRQRGRVVAHGQRADLGHHRHLLDRRMLAQQDLQDVAAFQFADQRRRDDANAPDQTMGDPEMLHWLLR